MKKYDDTYTTCKKTNATLRVFHEDLDPDEINNLLCLSYTRAHRKGDPTNAKGPEKGKYRYGAWLLNTEHHVNSRDVRRHIDWLLDQIEGKTDVIQYLFSKGKCTPKVGQFELRFL